MDRPPPSYGSPSSGPDDGALPPTTLYLAGRFVHADDPRAPPLYELSHSVDFLSDTDRVVRVERLDRSVRQLGGAPHVATRPRHVYDLTHPTAATPPAFAFHAAATSRQSLCSFGIANFRAPGPLLSAARGYRVHRAAREVADAGGLMSLLVSAEMGPRARDALVSAWILRLWWDLARVRVRAGRWDDAKRIMRSRNPELSGYRV